MSQHYPCVVIGGTTSGVGKTSVATGLMAALTRTGRVVQGHKVGPDYIDPSWHELATGRPRRNLDVMMAGADQIAPLVRQAAEGSDLAVIEGVMGLFDGASPKDDHASTAHVARLLNAPIVLVVDAANVSRSVAATVYGFMQFPGSPGSRPARIAGVIANRVGSAKHADLVTKAIEGIGVPVFGCLPRVPELATPSRHLGLIPVAERTEQAQMTVDGLANWVAADVDIERIAEWAAQAKLPEVAPWHPGENLLDGANPVRIAVAEGEAFSFQYTENVLALEAAGAELVPFDPMTDAALPEGTEVVWIGGGFPEMHALKLTSNTALINDLKAFADRGGLLMAECAGLLYLGEILDGHGMAGLIQTRAAMSTKLTLGYRRAKAGTSSLLWDKGETLTGHEFHRTRLTHLADLPSAWTLTDPYSGQVTTEGVVAGSGNIHAAYLHTQWVNPSPAQRLVRTALAKRQMAA